MTTDKNGTLLIFRFLRRFFAVALASFLAFGPASASEKKIKEFDKEIKSTSAELKKIEEDLKKKRRERDLERQKEDRFRKELRRIDSELTALTARRREITRRIRSARANLAAAQKSLMGATTSAEASGRELKKTANILWLDKTRYSVFSGGSRDFEKRDIIIARKKNFREACRLQSECEAQVGRWESAAKELAALEARLEENLARQKNLKDEKSRLLTDTTARRVSLEDEIKELAETSKALGDMLSDLEARKQRTQAELSARARERDAASKFRGVLEWPVRGDVILRFGRNKRDDIDTPLISNGIRIKPRAASDVVAAAAGECMFAGSFRSYGQMVVLDHGGSLYTVYGLLEEIAVADGDKVTAGQKIGTSSNGSDHGAVYFEVRHDGQAADPLDWLKK